MRFSAPRSESSSPVRRRSRPAIRAGSSFGLPPDSDEEYDDNDDNSDTESLSSASSSSSDSFCYESESEVPPPQPKPQRAAQTAEDRFRMEDTMASIRLRVRHTDAYEEWEHQTRRDAFISARQEQTRLTSQLRQSQEQTHSRENSQLIAIHKRQMEEVEAALASFKLAQQTEEQRLRAQWQQRDKQLWERIENVIKFEENKVKVQFEAERRKKEEEDRKRKEAELQRRLAEEKQKAEEEKKRKEEEERQQELKRQAEQQQEQQQKQAEEQQKQAEEQQKQAELEKEKSQRLKAEEAERKKLGLSTAEDDWTRGRLSLRKLKDGPIKTVKANRELKSKWNAARREITPKVGQLTDDVQTIRRVSQQIVQIVRPNPPYSLDVYFAILSSLSKAILLQAEAEVTAEKRSAGPLAQLTANMLWNLEHFPEVFWAKLVQRTGGWPVPSRIPLRDVDGNGFTPPDRRKVAGWRKEDGQEESTGEHMNRIAGIMRVYTTILFAQTPKPLDTLYRLPRYWTWFARILSEPVLLQSPVAAEVIFTTLEVGGTQGKEIWGGQWIKLLAVLYDGVTTGIPGTEKLIGGVTPEGTAARVRAQLEIERIMGTNP